MSFAVHLQTLHREVLTIGDAGGVVLGIATHTG